MENIFNGLLEFPKKEDFDKFMDSLDRETALKILELGLNYSQQNGLYNLTESYCLYKCLNKLRETPKLDQKD